MKLSECTAINVCVTMDVYAKSEDIKYQIMSWKRADNFIKYDNPYWDDLADVFTESNMTVLRNDDGDIAFGENDFRRFVRHCLFDDDSVIVPAPGYTADDIIKALDANEVEIDVLEKHIIRGI